MIAVVQFSSRNPESLTSGICFVNNEMHIMKYLGMHSLKQERYTIEAGYCTADIPAFSKLSLWIKIFHDKCMFVDSSSTTGL